jgi:hypothetical protein
MNPNLIEQLEARHGAMRVADLTSLLGVDDKHGGFNRSTQHLLAVYLQESGNPMSF